MRAVSPLAVAALACGLASCEPTPGYSLRSELLAVHPGMTSSEVAAVLGAPGARSFAGSGEAWQYCRFLDSTKDTYATAWFVNSRLLALTTRDVIREPYVYCPYPEIDWGQVPPDVRVALEIR